MATTSTDGRPFLGARPGGRRRRARRDGASLDRYFDQIGGVDLLDADEEVRLAQAIEAGNAAAQRLAAAPVLVPEERARLQGSPQPALQRGSTSSTPTCGLSSTSPHGSPARQASRSPTSSKTATSG